MPQFKNRDEYERWKAEKLKSSMRRQVTEEHIETLAGAPNEGITQAQSEPRESELQSMGGKGVGIGFLGGVFIGWFLMVPIGAALTATGIGAIIGIPILLGGLFAPFYSMASGASAKKGSCLYCGHEIIVEAAQKAVGGVTCSACQKRMVIRGNRLIRIDEKR